MNTKFCKDCIHFLPEPPKNGHFSLGKPARCSAPALGFDPVMGTPVIRPAHEERTYEGDCGPHGIRFEQKAVSTC